MKKYFLLILFYSFTTCGLFAQPGATSFPVLSGPYLGQTPPGTTPQLFTSDVINTGMNERDFVVSADGKEIYYGLISGRTILIMWSREVNGKWSEPEAAPFSSDPNYFCLEPCLAPNGKKMFFLSNRTPIGKQPQAGWAYQNIWVADRSGDGSWGAPYEADTSINGNGAQYYPSITNEGTLYFTRVDPQVKKPAIYRCRFVNGKYQTAEKLPDIINNNGEPFNAFIAHDESYLIACVDKKANPLNPGKSNYYIYFRDEKDNWSGGIALGPEINIKGSNASSAYVTPDGKYLFFAAQKTDEKFTSNQGPLKLGYLKSLLQSPQNGGSDIYWVDAKILDKYKEQAKE